MNILYFSSIPPLTIASLRQSASPEAAAGYHALPAALQRALIFCWQWVQGQERFPVPTSGSTGPPKIIEVTRLQMLASIRHTQQALAFTSGHTALLCIDAAYIGGMMALARALEIGMDVVGVAPSAYPLRNLPQQADVLALVPLQLQTLIDDDLASLNRAHVTLVGGAPVSPTLEETICARVSSPVYSTYGMTETASHVALRRLNGPEASDQFQVLGDTTIGTDERGCLTLQGAVTGQQLIVTNDLVALADERRFRWLGRHDWVINSGGVKVLPELVEQAVATQWTLAAPLPRFLVVGVPDAHLGQRVVLVVEGPIVPDTEQRSLLQAVSAVVPRYHAPREISFVDAIPQTATGKADRRETVAKLLRTVI